MAESRYAKLDAPLSPISAFRAGSERRFEV